MSVAAPAYAQTVTANFSKGAIAEYSGNPNGTNRGILFSTLNVASMSISQNSTNGQWGGTQGNDTAVTATITFTNGTTTTFPAAINWVKNAGGGNFDWVGLTIGSGVTVNDGYTPSSGFSKTYVLQFPQSSLNLSALLPDQLDGSANAGAAINALNQYFPNATPPVITGPSGGAGATTSAISVDENQTGVTTLTADKAVTWAITGGADSARFQVSAGGVVTFVAAPDFEVPTDADTNNTYLLTVRATDGNGNTASQTITVTVRDLDDTAPVVTAGQSFSYAENQAVNAAVGTVAATDAVGVTGYRFAANSSTTSADGYYAISSTGVISLTAAGAAAGAPTNDFETTPNSFTYGIQARDAAGNWSASANVTLAVTDLNDLAPVITGPSGGAGATTSAISVDENQTGVTTLTADKAVTWAITGGADSARFQVSAGGVVTFVAAPDFEVPTDADTNNTYLLTVRATDGNGNTASQTITVTVRDLDDTAPVVTAGQSFSYAENQAVNAAVGTVAATDAVGVTGYRFAANSSTTSADGYYAISSTGVISLTAAGAAAGAPTNDFETTPNSFTYGIQARDAAGNWSASANVTLAVTDLNDLAPVITGPSGGAGATTSAISVDENQTGVTTLTADKAVTWAITGGADSARFQVSAGGVVTFVAAPDFEVPTDADTNNTYLLTVRATDGNGNTASQTITVTVRDLDDTAPVVTAGQSFSYAENQAVNAAVGTVAATDAVGVTGYRFAANSSTTSADGYYAISSTGVISLTAAGAAAGAPTNDFETTPNSFTYGIQARDAAGNWSASANVTLAVTDLNDLAPVITGPSGGAGATTSAISVDENQTGVTTLTADKAVTWAITGGADSARFQVSAGGVVTFVAAPDFEVPTDADTNNTYLLTVRATDGNGNTASQTITVTVRDLDDTAPVVTAGQSFSYAENQAVNAAVGTVAATDAVGVTGYRFAANSSTTSADGYYAISSTGVISLTAAGAAAGAPTNDFETTPNSFTYGIQARDAAGNWSASANVTLAVTDLNDLAPVITGPSGGAGATTSAISVDENQTGVTTLTADKAVTWAITGGADSARFQVSAGGVVTFVAAPDFEVPTDADTNNTYLLTVRATDGNGNTASQTITVTVRDLDDTAPVVTAGQSFSYAENQAVNAAVGTVAATDAVGVTGYRFAANSSTTSADGYYAISSTGVISLTAAGAAAGAPTNDFETTPNSFTYGIQARDAAGNWSASANVTLAVTDLNDLAPVITGPSGGAGATTSAISVDENQTGVTTLTADKAVTWAITGGADSARFQVSAGGVVTFVAAPDFEVPTDADTNNTYLLTVRATDGNGNTASQTITVTVRDLDDTAPVVTAGQSFSYAENQAVNAAVGTVAATDAVGVTGYRFAANSSTTSADGYYAISSTGVISLTAAGAAAGAPTNDFETTPNSFTYGIQARDAAGNWSASANVTLAVTDLNDLAPVITGPGGSAGDTSAINVPEGTTIVTTLSASAPISNWAIVGGNDQGRFSISSGGQISFTAAPDFENPTDSDSNNTYVLMVRATDANGNFATQTVTVTVTDVADTPPVLTGPGGSTGGTSSITVNEGTTEVTQLTANVPIASWTITGGNDQGQFAIDGQGRITFVAAPDYESPTDSDTNNTYVLTITGADANGLTTSHTLTVSVADLPDIAPVLTGPGGATGATAAASVPEGTTTVTTMTANVPISTWAIVGGNDSGRFAIDGDGRITFVAAPDFEAPSDSDANNTYVLVVEGTDANGNRQSQTITVYVIDVADVPPVLTGPGGATGATSAITVPEGTTAVTQVAANVPIATWAITGGNDGGRFAIDNQGRITFVAAPDYEAPSDSDTNNTYVLTITGTDLIGLASNQTITVTVADVADTPPVISGPGGATGAIATLTVNEGTTSVVTLASNVPVTWAITGGNDRGQFAVSPSGAIAFVAAPDFEAPGDSDANNTYVLTITATDASGQSSSQQITVTVADLPDTPPVLTGPGGATGATASIAIPEGTTTVATMTANVPISSWAIIGGNDQGRFAVSSAGVVSFVAAPDYERPADSDTNNTYILTVQGTDASGNRTLQTLTVTVTDVADTAPAITGPSGGPGAAASDITVSEGTTVVTTLTANVPVTWSIVGGNDRGQFAIGPAGAITFVVAPDFEAPADSDRNNVYMLTVQARDANGNVSTQTVTVTVADVDEIGRKLEEIGADLRGDLRNQAFASLSTMLAFNETLLGLDNACAGASGRKPVSGGINANEDSQGGGVKFARDLSSCESKTRLFVDGGIGINRIAGNWTTRGLASARIEQRIGARTVVGVAVIGSASSDRLASFTDSAISDQSIQANVYGRTWLSDSLRLGAFAGWGRAWYDFEMRDGGFDLKGDMTGKRHLFGAALSGDIVIGGATVTTDAVLSRAVEKLGSANLDASLGGENRQNILFRLRKVDITRLSVPVHVPIVFKAPADGREPTRLDLSPGLLCQDTAQDSSTLDCGFQIGAKFRVAPSLNSLVRVEGRVEAVDGFLQNTFSVGFQRRFGLIPQLNWGVDVSRSGGAARSDNRVVVRFGFR